VAVELQFLDLPLALLVQLIKVISVVMELLQEMLVQAQAAEQVPQVALLHLVKVESAARELVPQLLVAL
jgi:hypothetical protein